MKKKLLILFEIFLIIGMFSWYIVKEMIPDVSKKFGSSDHIVNTKRFQNMIDFKIDSSCEFAILLDDEGIVYHMFFFHRDSVCLYNQNIEGLPLEKAIPRISDLLIQNGCLKKNSSIVITRVLDFHYEDILSHFKNSIFSFSQSITFLEEKKSLEDFALEFGVSYDNLSSLLSGLDYYSKNITGIGRASQSVSYDGRELSNHVYQELEQYVFVKQIKNLEKESTDFPISLIPGDSSLKMYPTSRSWYYVQNGKIFAYIEFELPMEVVGYCYQGSIDLRKEGECIYE